MGQIFKNSKKQDFIKKILIVGTGDIALRHYKNILKLNKNYQIDFFTRSLRKNINHSLKNVNYINNYKEILKINYYAAILCNPSSHHLKFAIDLGKKGTNLFIEKPISSGNIKDVIKLLKLSQKKKITLQVGYNLLYLNSLIYLNKLIKSNKYGKINLVRANTGFYLPFWRKKNYKNSVSAKKNLGGGVLLELSHEISYLIWLLGLPNKIYAEIGKLSNLKIDTEDFANLILKFGNQISCSCNLDFLSKSYTRKLEFIAQKGNIYWDYKSNTIKEKFFLGNNKFSKNKKIKFKKNNTYFHSMKKFFLLCKNKKKNTDIFNAINSLKVIIQAKKSAKLNKSIFLRKKYFSI